MSLTKTIRIALLLLLASLAQLMGVGYSANYNTNQITYDNDKSATSYQVVKIDGLLFNSQVGAPQLPVEYINLAIPSNMDATSISLTSDIEIQSGLHNLLPVQTPRTTNDGDLPFVNPDPVVYTQNAFYPANVAEIVNQGYLNGSSKIVTIKISPLQYNPVTQQIRLNKNISFSLNLGAAAHPSLQPAVQFAKDKATYQTLLKAVVKNPQEAVGYSYQPQTAAYGGESFDYLIVTPAEYANSFTEFIKWKQDKGNVVKVVTYEQIASMGYTTDYSNTYPITDAAGGLREYLKNAYQTKGLTYALLVGDHTNSPIRLKGQQQFGGQNNIPSDLYFADFNGNWNNLQPSSTNPIPPLGTGTIDYNKEIFVGRLPVPTHADNEIQNWIHKTITYESSPGYGDNSYLKNAFFESADGVYHSGPAPLIGDYLITKGFNSEVMLEANYYQTTENYYDISFPTGKQVIETMANNKHFVALDCHGLASKVNVATKGRNDLPPARVVSADATCINDWDLPEDGTNNLAFDKINGRYQFYWSTSCENAAFDQTEGTNDCFSRAFATANKETCGPAIIANTRFGWTYSSPYLRSQFFKVLFEGYNGYEQSNKKVGVAEAASKSIYTDSYLAHSSNLVGDPEMDLWTDFPTSLVASLNGSSVTVTDINGNPVANALVTFVNESNFSSLGYSDANGVVTVPDFGNIVRFTATKTGCLPSRNLLVTTSQNFNTSDNYENILITGQGTLNIVAGTNLKMFPGTKIVVQKGGVLNINGTVSNRVVISSQVDGKIWDGISSDGTGTINISYANIANTTNAITGFANTNINNCRITNCQNGVNLVEPSSVEIKNSTFSNCFNGIVVRNSNPLIDCPVVLTNNNITGNGTTQRNNGISLYNAGVKQSVISDNTVTNFNNGISISYGNAYIKHNTVYGCTSGVYIFESSPLLNKNKIFSNTVGVQVLGFAAPVLNPFAGFGTPDTPTGGVNRIANNTNGQISYDLNSRVLLDNGKNDIYASTTNYPLIKKATSQQATRTIYITNNYWGAGFNPLKPASYFSPANGFTFTPYSTTPNTNNIDIDVEIPDIELLGAFDKGLKNEIDGDNSEAKTIYTNLLATDPDNADAILPRLEYTRAESGKSSILDNLHSDSTITDFTYYSALAQNAYNNNNKQVAADNYLLKMDNSVNHTDSLITKINLLDLIWNDGSKAGSKAANKFKELVCKNEKEYTAKRDLMLEELLGGKAGVSNSENLVTDFVLQQNYPNPFNPSTVIRYALPEQGNVKIMVYNMVGAVVAEFNQGMKNRGQHQITFDGSNYSAGMYVYMLEYNGKPMMTKKMVMLK